MSIPRRLSCTSLMRPSARRVTAPLRVATVWLPAGATCPVAVRGADAPAGRAPPAVVVAGRLVPIGRDPLAIGALDRFAVGAFAVGWFVVAAPGLAGDDVAGLVELPAGFAGAAAGLAGAAGFFVVL